MTAALFPRDKFQDVVNDKADCAVFQMGQRHVFLGPLNHPFTGIDMHDFIGPGAGARHRRSAGVGEQVQDPDRPAGGFGLADFTLHPIPVDRLLRKQSGMLEAGRGNLKGQLFIGYRPGLRDGLFEFPASSAPV